MGIELPREMFGCLVHHMITWITLLNAEIIQSKSYDDYILGV